MGLALDEPGENEKATKVNGIDVLIADDVKGIVDGSTVDYMDTEYEKGFTVRSKNEC